MRARTATSCSVERYFGSMTGGSCGLADLRRIVPVLVGLWGGASAGAGGQLGEAEPMTNLRRTPCTAK